LNGKNQSYKSLCSKLEGCSRYEGIKRIWNGEEILDYIARSTYRMICKKIVGEDEVLYDKLWKTKALPTA